MSLVYIEEARPELGIGKYGEFTYRIMDDPHNHNASSIYEHGCKPLKCVIKHKEEKIDPVAVKVGLQASYQQSTYRGQSGTLVLLRASGVDLTRLELEAQRRGYTVKDIENLSKAILETANKEL